MINYCVCVCVSSIKASKVELLLLPKNIGNSTTMDRDLYYIVYCILLNNYNHYFNVLSSIT